MTPVICLVYVVTPVDGYGLGAIIGNMTLIELHTTESTVDTNKGIIDWRVYNIIFLYILIELSNPS